MLSPTSLSQNKAAELGYKAGTSPTILMASVVGAIKAGLNALNAGQGEAPGALDSAALRLALGYQDYDTQAKRFATEDMSDDGI